MGIDAEMLVKTRQQITPEQVRRLSGDLVEAFGSGRFWIDENYKDWETDKVVGRHALEIVNKYEQDGPDLEPQPGEQFIRVHLWTRFYGKGYERGDIGFIILVAMWLESRIPDAVIFYGGDSSGVCAEPFDATARAEIWKHFTEVGHSPYTGGFGMFTGENNHAPHCDFCDRQMFSSGGGGGDTFYSCGGCGKRAIYLGKTKEVVALKKGEDFLAGHKRLETEHAQR